MAPNTILIAYTRNAQDSSFSFDGDVVTSVFDLVHRGRTRSLHKGRRKQIRDMLT